MSETDTPTLIEGEQNLFEALTQAFDAAQVLIHLETYIFDFYGVGQCVADAMCRAAQRGVLVRVMVDGVGTEPLPAEWAEKFRVTGVQWCVYSPLGAGLGRLGAAGRRLSLLSPKRWRRLHRKLCGGREVGILRRHQCAG